MFSDLVEHSGVKPGVHALARPPCRKASTSPHHHVQHTEGDEVRVLVADTLKTCTIFDDVHTG